MVLLAVFVLCTLVVLYGIESVSEDSGCSVLYMSLVERIIPYCSYTEYFLVVMKGTLLNIFIALHTTFRYYTRDNFDNPS